jgi:hypothetical protein
VPQRKMPVLASASEAIKYFVIPGWSRVREKRGPMTRFAK